ncbi:MAG: DUF1653 domain-containing protein [Bacilli bacterium]|nr:DUF1653 domain-containing protein [Bacilli bacterium]
MREVKINCFYKHFKGMIVKVLLIAKDSEDLSEKVVYSHDNEIWVRDKNEFLSLVDKKKYPNIKQKYRFEEVKGDNDI